MKKAILGISFILFLLLPLSACKQSEGTNDVSSSGQQEVKQDTESNSVSASPAILEKINAKEAKEMMDSSEDYVILDVRTQEEYQEGHIEGAILLPDYDITAKAETVLENKDTTILVYCRSGRRSALAAQALSNLGYTKVYDFGGIIDWPYEVVTE